MTTLDAFRQTAPDGGYPPDAVTLADHLESVMGEGVHDLPGIAAALEARSVRFDGVTAWTPETLAVTLARLADA